ncbi:MAG TPA: CocE/NonD family hydrolase [Steroidobacteraceae bacterium]
MRTRDGVRLDADIYRPDTGGSYPVLLMRQPYGRRIASTVTYAHPSWYAAQGYIVVIQDVRGRGSSEGEFRPFVHEREDGFDSVQWAAALPGSNGRVGMYGFSYQGMTQLYAAAAKPPALKTICPAMIGYDIDRDWAYEGGAFRLQANLAWAVQVEAETARREGDERRFAALSRAGKALQMTDTTPAMPTSLAPFLAQSFYREWLDREQDAGYWRELSPRSHLAETDLPALHIGGWYDSFLTGTIACYLDFSARCRSPQQLVIGPWAHLPWGRRVGDLDLGPDASSPIDRLQVAWFDHVLKKEAPAESGVSLFELGSNRWRSFDQWPQGTPFPLYLGSTGIAAIRSDDGRLVSEPATTTTADTFVHDPWRPAPSVGGHAGFGAGPVERSSVDERSDVLVYTTAPFESPRTFAGNVEAHIWCDADAPSFDLSLVLSEVRADGRVYCITQGYLRVRAGDGVQCHKVEMRAMCACIPAGHALRLSVSAACFPAYDVNPGAGTPVAQARLIEQKVITVRVLSGRAHPSHVRLPLIVERPT